MKNYADLEEPFHDRSHLIAGTTTRPQRVRLIENYPPRPTSKRLLGRSSDGQATIPERPGLLDTPARLVRSFREFFAGYSQDPASILKTTFEEIEGYDEMIVLRGIGFESHCEHHLAPILGRAWVAYVPSGRVVGISKLAGGGCVCEALADLGKNDGTDCKHD